MALGSGCPVCGDCGNDRSLVRLPWGNRLVCPTCDPDAWALRIRFCRFIAINAVIMWLLIAIAGPVDISRSVRMGSPVRLIRTAISGDLPARASFSRSAPIRSYLAPCLLVLNLLDWQCNVPEDANHGNLGNDGTAFCDLE